MGRAVINIGVMSVFIFIASGCNKDENKWIKNTIEFSTIPIEVKAEMSYATKGSDPIGIDEIENFGMSAIWQLDSSMTNRWLLTDQMVQKDTSGGLVLWRISPPAFWPLTGKLSFFFYTPFNDSLHPEIQFIPSTTGMPGITFTPGQDPTNHYDFCVATPLLNRTSGQGALIVTFDHVLTRIHLLANYDGLLPPNVEVKIDSIKFKNIYGSKNIYFKPDSTKYEWQDEAGLIADATYSLSAVAGHLIDTALVQKNIANDNHKSIYRSAGRLYLLPQALSPDAFLQVYYGFYKGTICTASFVKEIPFKSGSVWPMGKLIHLKLTLGVGLSSETVLNTEVENWIDSFNKSNGGDPIEYE